MAKKPTGHVRLRPNGSYEVIVSMGVDPRSGKRLTKSKSLAAGSTEEEAEAVKATLLAKARKQRSRHSRSTVAGLLEEYVAQFEGAWTPGSLKETRRVIDRRLVPALGDKSLARLTVADVDRFYRQLRTNGRRPNKAGELPEGASAGLSEATVQRIHRVLHAALELGVRWDLLPDNPSSRATLHELDEVETNPPTAAEALALLAAADEVDDAFGAYIRIAAASGARRGELCGLLRSGVDSEAHTLLIRRVAGYGPDGLTSWERTKARRRRITPIGAGAFAILEAHLLKMDKRALGKGVGRLPKTAYVWSNAMDCSKPWDPEYQTRRWIKLRRTLDLDHVRLHDLRHFAGTQIAELTGNQKMAQAQLGHRTLAMSDRYVHVVPEAQREAAEKLDRLLSGQATA